VQEEDVQFFTVFTNSVMDQDTEDCILLEVSAVLEEFEDCFSTAQPGVKFANLPPDVTPDQGNLNHNISLKSSSPQPFSHNSIHFSTAELDMLKKQLQDLIELGYIQPSSSSWRALVLFAKKKKDETL
jgi:hypothetical protein